jgi:hypothetical protein
MTRGGPPDPDEELDRFVEKRYQQRIKAEGNGRPQEAEWARSERETMKARRQANKEAWADYHGRIASYHYARAKHHLKERRRVEQMSTSVMPSRTGRYNNSDGPEAA